MLGKHGGPPLIVRQHTSRLRTALLIAGVLIGVPALYVVYELGRYDAGYDRQAVAQQRTELEVIRDRKSTRLNSSHDQISYAVFCLKKKKKPHSIACMLDGCSSCLR